MYEVIFSFLFYVQFSAFPYAQGNWLSTHTIWHAQILAPVLDSVSIAMHTRPTVVWLSLVQWHGMCILKIQTLNSQYLGPKTVMQHAQIEERSLSWIPEQYIAMYWPSFHATFWSDLDFLQAYNNLDTGQKALLISILKAKCTLQKQHPEFSLEPLSKQHGSVETRILYLELSYYQPTSRSTLILSSTRHRLSTYPTEPALSCIKLVSTLQLPKSHNCTLNSWRSSKSREVHKAPRLSTQLPCQ